jgi:hypothetical protein
MFKMDKCYPNDKEMTCEQDYENKKFCIELVECKEDLMNVERVNIISDSSDGSYLYSSHESIYSDNDDECVWF